MTELDSAVVSMLKSFLDLNLKYMSEIAGPNWQSLAVSNMTESEIEEWKFKYGNGFDATTYSEMEVSLCKCEDYLSFFRDIPSLEQLILRLVDFRQGMMNFHQFLIDSEVA